MAWLLDTNVWIHYLRNPDSRVRAALVRHTPDEIAVCAVVKAELLHGAMKYGAPERRLAVVREALALYRSLPFDDAAAEHYARIRHELEHAGGRIGPHDLLIAAICLTHGCILVTSNLAEFRRVRGLQVEDWTTD
jgi:tRNA(fMet)-specific endonuclease VapC